MSRRLWDLVVVQWCLLLALVVALPWRGSGFLLSYDMVTPPRWTLGRDDLWGLGSAVPRAVPSDGVLALVSQAVDPALLQRLVIVGALALGGVGAARLVDDAGLGARLVAGTYALWNPLVAERLLLGQWPVLVALACLPWIGVALRDPDRPRVAALTLALAGTALTAATGVMGLLAALVVGWRSGPIRMVLLAALVNAPWIVAGLVRPGTVVSDPAGVELFALQGEGPWGRIGALMALGGVWNAEVVPASRLTLVATLVVVVLWVLMLTGLRRWWRADRYGVLAWSALAAVGYTLACWGWLAPGLLERLIEWQGATAVLRDGSRYLVFALPFHAVALGYGAATLGGWLARTSGQERWRAVAAGLLVAAPLAALPDLGYGVGGRLTPADYPRDWEAARQAVGAVEAEGDLLVLPFSPYRAPDWNDGRTVLDPAGRFFDRDTVTSDALTVSGVTLASEDPRAVAVGEALADPAATSADLAAQGIGVVVLDSSAPGGDPTPAALSGARAVETGEDGLRVFVVDGVATLEPPPVKNRVLVWAAWGVAGLTVAVSALSIGRRGLARLIRLLGSLSPFRGRRGKRP
ncbi:MAG: hypothetical protein QM621_12730 [Aeromicrobium sp.]|uniref:hypothetical protein n=1 Tax=Aeromicrobium sp. TaxID=1871063 RepID=UPI0039E6244F